MAKQQQQQQQQDQQPPQPQPAEAAVKKPTKRQRKPFHRKPVPPLQTVTLGPADRGKGLGGFLTVREAATRLGITPGALRERLRRRQIPVVKVGYLTLLDANVMDRLQ